MTPKEQLLQTILAKIRTDRGEEAASRFELRWRRGAKGLCCECGVRLRDEDFRNAGSILASRDAMLCQACLDADTSGDYHTESDGLQAIEEAVLSGNRCSCCLAVIVMADFKRFSAILEFRRTGECQACQDAIYP